MTKKISQELRAQRRLCTCMHAIRFLPSFVYFPLAHIFSLSLFRPCLASGNIKGKCNSIWVNPWGGSGEAQLLAAPSIHPFGSNQWVFFSQEKFHQNFKRITQPPHPPPSHLPSKPRLRGREGGQGEPPLLAAPSSHFETSQWVFLFR